VQFLIYLYLIKYIIYYQKEKIIQILDFGINLKMLRLFLQYIFTLHFIFFILILLDFLNYCFIWASFLNFVAKACLFF